jgi:anaerobic ribonucleoside-triphosphate reductase activating protein
MSSPNLKAASKQMNKELVFILEPDVGRLTLEFSRSPLSAIDELESVLGPRANVNCAKPASVDESPALRSRKQPQNGERDEDPFTIWLYRLYHNSTVDGPGRRSVVQVSGCSIRCQGCYVPQTHKSENGVRVPIASIVDEILANRAEHDGVTILGGEPFDQPGQVAELAARLKRYGLHLTIYTGYSLEALIGRKEPNIDYILTQTDLLIDGPYIREFAKNAGEYRGSRNQRLILGPKRS